jgi:hypothetical protein
MPTGPLLLGIAIGTASIVAGALVAMGRSGQLWGAVLVAGALLGAVFVGPHTGWFTMAAVFTLLAGVLALLTRSPRRAV